MRQIVPYCDLIVLGEGDDVDLYARNEQGLLHVPVSSMSVEQVQRAYALYNPLARARAAAEERSCA